MSNVSIPVLMPGLPPGLVMAGRRSGPEFERAMSQAHSEIATWMAKYPAPEGSEAHWYIALFRPNGQLRIEAAYGFDAAEMRAEAQFTAEFAEAAELLYACEHLADMKLTAGGKNILGDKKAAKR